MATAKQLSQRRLRLLLVDDHVMIAEALKDLLYDDFEIVSLVSDAEHIEAMTQRTKRDPLILDIAMPRVNGLEAAWNLKRRMPDKRIVFLTMLEDANIAVVDHCFASRQAIPPQPSNFGG